MCQHGFSYTVFCKTKQRNKTIRLQLSASFTGWTLHIEFGNKE